MNKCPICSKECADFEGTISLNGKVLQKVKGLLCGECYVIWSPTKIDNAIPLKMFI